MALASVWACGQLSLSHEVAILNSSLRVHAQQGEAVTARTAYPPGILTTSRGGG